MYQKGGFCSISNRWISKSTCCVQLTSTGSAFVIKTVQAINYRFTSPEPHNLQKCTRTGLDSMLMHNVAATAINYIVHALVIDVDKNVIIFSTARCSSFFTTHHALASFAGNRISSNFNSVSLAPSYTRDLTWASSLQLENSLVKMCNQIQGCWLQEYKQLLVVVRKQENIKLAEPHGSTFVNFAAY